MNRMLSGEQKESPMLPNIKVIGIGGGGINAVNHMMDCGMQGVEYIAVSGDSCTLGLSKAHKRINIRENRPQGLGMLTAEAYRHFAEEARNVLKENLQGADMVLVIAGMGGGSGSGASSVVASCALELGALAVAVVTKPFEFEGRRRRKIAETSIDELRKNADTVIIISNDSILPLIKNIGDQTPLMEAFRTVDDTIFRCVQSIVDSIHVPGMVNVEFSEIKQLLSNAGFAKMGYGSAKGGAGARNAAKAAAENSLMESAVEGATGVFLSITSGEDINFQDETDVIDVLSELATPDAKFVWGAMVDNKLAKDEFQVTAIALNPNITIKNDKGLDSMEFNFKPENSRTTIATLGLPIWMGDEKSDEEEKPTEDLVPRPDGKEVCAYLRNIRIDLARANNIPFDSEPCNIDGDCAGTCAKCDEEAAYLRDELNKIPEQERKIPQHILSDWEEALCSAK